MEITGLSWILIMVSIAALWLSQVRFSRLQSKLSSLQQWSVVDLTHTLTPAIPIWPGDPELKMTPWANYTETGYFIHQITIGEHSGTHWGTPNTLIEQATSAEQVSIDKLVVPAVVIDIRRQTRQNQDYRLSIQDVQLWEAAYGPVTAGSIVLLQTGWQDRWQNPAAFMNKDTDGVSHWPGFGVEAVEFLVADRLIVGLGTDTHGVDPGDDEKYEASAAIYAADGLILECLTGLEQLPPRGATLVVGGLPIQGGAGSPARVFAFTPPRLQM